MKTYNLAVVFDDILTHFDASSRELLRLHQRLASQIQRIDLAFLRPATLICRLGFDPSFVSASKIADRLSVAQSRHFRVLDLMSISGSGGRDLFDQQAESASWHRCPSENIEADLNDLRQTLGDRIKMAERREAGRCSVAIVVRFSGCPEAGVGMARELSGRGLYIESDSLPKPGTELVLELEPLRNTELKTINAKVVHVLSHDAARPAGRVPGFGVVMSFDSGHKQLFESFLVSAIRGLPWPERSGRRYDRFPISLQVRWEAGDVQIEAHTANISRGGMFICTDVDQAPGTEGTLIVHGPIGERQATLRARVTHGLVSKNDGTPRGLGLELLDRADLVDEQLARVLGAAQLPPIYRALIVDDDVFFVRLLGSAMRRCGYDVAHAKSAEAAMKLLMEELFRFDAIIVDLHLPGITGKAFIEWLSKIDGCDDVSIFLVSAIELSAEEQQGLLALGATEVLVKNVEADRMAAVVDDRVSRHRS